MKKFTKTIEFNFKDNKINELIKTIEDSWDDELQLVEPELAFEEIIECVVEDYIAESINLEDYDVIFFEKEIINFLKEKINNNWQIKKNSV